MIIHKFMLIIVILWIDFVSIIFGFRVGRKIRLILSKSWVNIF